MLYIAHIDRDALEVQCGSCAGAEGFRRTCLRAGAPASGPASGALASGPASGAPASGPASGEVSRLPEVDAADAEAGVSAAASCGRECLPSGAEVIQQHSKAQHGRKTS